MARIDSSVARVRSLMDELGLTDRWLARKFRAHHATVNNWRAGRQTPPVQIIIWMEQLADFYRRNPPPDFRELDQRGERDI